MTDRRVVILGAGGFAREVAEMLGALGDWDIAGFVERDEARSGYLLNGIPILARLSDLAGLEECFGVPGAGDVAPRNRQITEMESAGLRPLSIVHPMSVVSPSAILGDGAVACQFTTITANSSVGAYSMVNYGATVGHDVHVGRNCVIGPGARISGWVTLGDGCYIGAGAVILPRVTIGAGAIVGAGAVVTREVEPGVTVVGVPARPMS